MTNVIKSQKAITFLNIHTLTNVPQNVLSKNLKELQRKRINPQLYFILTHFKHTSLSN